MTKAKDIFDYTQSFAPLCLAMPYDNCGILVGDSEKEVSKAIVTLDITSDVIDEAVRKGAELIISHHPIIFSPLKSVGIDSCVYKLIQNGITALCMHTNLDLSQENGVNITLAKALGLENIAIVEGECLLTGELQTEYSVEDFAKYVKERLDCQGVRYTKGEKSIRRVAVACGAGGDYVFNCEKLGADAFVTGEIKHHQIIKANEIGLTIVDAGHYKTEDVIIPVLVRLLSEKFADTQFYKSEAFNDNVFYL